MINLKSIAALSLLASPLANAQQIRQSEVIIGNRSFPQGTTSFNGGSITNSGNINDTIPASPQLPPHRPFQKLNTPNSILSPLPQSSEPALPLINNNSRGSIVYFDASGQMQVRETQVTQPTRPNASNNGISSISEEPNLNVVSIPNEVKELLPATITDFKTKLKIKNISVLPRDREEFINKCTDRGFDFPAEVFKNPSESTLSLQKPNTRAKLLVALSVFHYLSPEHEMFSNSQVDFRALEPKAFERAMNEGRLLKMERLKNDLKRMRDTYFRNNGALTK